MSNFPRGSEWRKWDFHIHTPGTAKNDNYTGHEDIWKAYIAKLESFTDIAVLGITDHLSIENYIRGKHMIISYQFKFYFREKDPKSADTDQKIWETHKTVNNAVKEMEKILLLLLLKGGHGLPALAQRRAVSAADEKGLARFYLAERIAREMALGRKKSLADSVPDREGFIRRGFNCQEAELAAARAKHSDKARNGNRKAMEVLEDVKRQQRDLAARRENALAILRREPELIAPGAVTFIAHALVVPSSDPADIEQHDANVELVAMQVAQAFEEAAGAKVIDVHTPELARRAGLPDNPGFDFLFVRSGNEKLSIEVKGRAATGDIEVSANEWAKACNMRQGYWLYASYNCATSTPRLVRVQDPFGNLLAKVKGSVLASASAVVEAGET